jgi:hypothetical protein
MLNSNHTPHLSDGLLNGYGHLRLLLEMTRAILHRPELTDGNPQKRDRNPDPGKPLIETLIGESLSDDHRTLTVPL